ADRVGTFLGGEVAGRIAAALDGVRGADATVRAQSTGRALARPEQIFAAASGGSLRALRLLLVGVRSWFDMTSEADKLADQAAVDGRTATALAWHLFGTESVTDRRDERARARFGSLDALLREVADMVAAGATDEAIGERTLLGEEAVTLLPRVPVAWLPVFALGWTAVQSDAIGGNLLSMRVLATIALHLRAAPTETPVAWRDIARATGLSTTEIRNVGQGFFNGDRLGAAAAGRYAASAEDLLDGIQRMLLEEGASPTQVRMDAGIKDTVAAAIGDLLRRRRESGDTVDLKELLLLGPLAVQPLARPDATRVASESALPRLRPKIVRDAALGKNAELAHAALAFWLDVVQAKLSGLDVEAIAASSGMSSQETFELFRAFMDPTKTKQWEARSDSRTSVDRLLDRVGEMKSMSTTRADIMKETGLRAPVVTMLTQRYWTRDGSLSRNLREALPARIDGRRLSALLASAGQSPTAGSTALDESWIDIVRTHLALPEPAGDGSTLGSPMRRLSALLATVIDAPADFLKSEALARFGVGLDSSTRKALGLDQAGGPQFEAAHVVRLVLSALDAGDSARTRVEDALKAWSARGRRDIPTAGSLTRRISFWKAHEALAAARQGHLPALREVLGAVRWIVTSGMSADAMRFGASDAIAQSRQMAWHFFGVNDAADAAEWERRARDRFGSFGSFVETLGTLLSTGAGDEEIRDRLLLSAEAVETLRTVNPSWLPVIAHGLDGDDATPAKLAELALGGERVAALAVVNAAMALAYSNSVIETKSGEIPREWWEVATAGGLSLGKQTEYSVLFFREPGLGIAKVRGSESSPEKLLRKVGAMFAGDTDSDSIAKVTHLSGEVIAILRRQWDLLKEAGGDERNLGKALLLGPVLVSSAPGWLAGPEDSGVSAPTLGEVTRETTADLVRTAALAGDDEALTRWLRVVEASLSGVNRRTQLLFSGMKAGETDKLVDYFFARGGLGLIKRSSGGSLARALVAVGRLFDRGVPAASIVRAVGIDSLVLSMLLKRHQPGVDLSGILKKLPLLGGSSAPGSAATSVPSSDTASGASSDTEWTDARALSWLDFVRTSLPEGVPAHWPATLRAPSERLAALLGWMANDPAGFFGSRALARYGLGLDLATRADLGLDRLAAPSREAGRLLQLLVDALAEDDQERIVRIAQAEAERVAQAPSLLARPALARAEEVMSALRGGDVRALQLVLGAVAAVGFGDAKRGAAARSLADLDLAELRRLGTLVLGGPSDGQRAVERRAFFSLEAAPLGSFAEFVDALERAAAGEPTDAGPAWDDLLIIPEAAQALARFNPAWIRVAAYLKDQGNLEENKPTLMAGGFVTEVFLNAGLALLENGAAESPLADNLSVVTGVKPGQITRLGYKMFLAQGRAWTDPAKNRTREKAEAAFRTYRSPAGFLAAVDAKLSMIDTAGTAAVGMIVGAFKVSSEAATVLIRAYREERESGGERSLAELVWWGFPLKDGATDAMNPSTEPAPPQPGAIPAGEPADQVADTDPEPEPSIALTNQAGWEDFVASQPGGRQTLVDALGEQVVRAAELLVLGVEALNRELSERAQQGESPARADLSPTDVSLLAAWADARSVEVNERQRSFPRLTDLLDADQPRLRFAYGWLDAGKVRAVDVPAVVTLIHQDATNGQVQNVFETNLSAAIWKLDQVAHPELAANRQNSRRRVLPFVKVLIEEGREAGDQMLRELAATVNEIVDPQAASQMLELLRQGMPGEAPVEQIEVPWSGSSTAPRAPRWGRPPWPVDISGYPVRRRARAVSDLPARTRGLLESLAKATPPAQVANQRSFSRAVALRLLHEQNADLVAGVLTRWWDEVVLPWATGAEGAALSWRAALAKHRAAVTAWIKAGSAGERPAKPKLTTPARPTIEALREELIGLAEFEPGSLGDLALSQFVAEVRAALELLATFAVLRNSEEIDLTPAQAIAATRVGVRRRTLADARAKLVRQDEPKGILVSLPHAVDNRKAAWAALAIRPRGAMVWLTTPFMAHETVVAEATAFMPAGMNVVTSVEKLIDALRVGRGSKPFVAVLPHDTLADIRRTSPADFAGLLDALRAWSGESTIVVDQAVGAPGSDRSDMLADVAPLVTTVIALNDVPLSRDPDAPFALARLIGMGEVGSEAREVYADLVPDTVMYGGRGRVVKPQFVAMPAAGAAGVALDSLVDSGRVDVHAPRHLAAEAKLPAIAASVLDQVRAGGRAVVLSKYDEEGAVKAARYLRDSFARESADGRAGTVPTVEYITGKTGFKERANLLGRFARGEIDVLVTTYTAFPGAVVVDSATLPEGGFLVEALNPPTTPVEYQALTSMLYLPALPLSVPVEVVIRYQQRVVTVQGGKQYQELSQDQQDLDRLEALLGVAAQYQDHSASYVPTQAQAERYAVGDYYGLGGGDSFRFGEDPTALPRFVELFTSNEGPPAWQQSTRYLTEQVRALVAEARRARRKTGDRGGVVGPIGFVDFGSGLGQLVMDMLAAEESGDPSAYVDQAWGIDRFPAWVLAELETAEGLGTRLPSGPLRTGTHEHHLQGRVQDAARLLGERSTSRVDFVTASFAMLSQDPQEVFSFVAAAAQVLNVGGRFLIVQPLSTFDADRVGVLYAGLGRLGFEVTRDERLNTAGAPIRFLDLTKIAEPTVTELDDLARDQFTLRGETRPAKNGLTARAIPDHGNSDQGAAHPTPIEAQPESALSRFVVEQLAAARRSGLARVQVRVLGWAQVEVRLGLDHGHSVVALARWLSTLPDQNALVRMYSVNELSDDIHLILGASSAPTTVSVAACQPIADFQYLPELELAVSPEGVIYLTRSASDVSSAPQSRIAEGYVEVRPSVWARPYRPALLTADNGHPLAELLHPMNRIGDLAPRAIGGTADALEIAVGPWTIVLSPGTGQRLLAVSIRGTELPTYAELGLVPNDGTPLDPARYHEYQALMQQDSDRVRWWLAPGEDLADVLAEASIVADRRGVPHQTLAGLLQLFMRIADLMALTSEEHGRSPMRSGEPRRFEFNGQWFRVHPRFRTPNGPLSSPTSAGGWWTEDSYVIQNLDTGESVQFNEAMPQWIARGFYGGKVANGLDYEALVRLFAGDGSVADLLIAAHELGVPTRPVPRFLPPPADAGSLSQFLSTDVRGKSTLDLRTIDTHALPDRVRFGRNLTALQQHHLGRLHVLWPEGGLDLSHLDLTGLDLRGHHLDGWNFAGANLSHARLGDAEGANFNGANLSGARLYSARGASFVDANLSGVDLTSVELNGADLRGANLERATLLHTTLTSADLRNATLRGANLSGAVLWFADLRGALLGEREWSREQQGQVAFRPKDRLWGIPLESTSTVPLLRLRQALERAVARVENATIPSKLWRTLGEVLGDPTVTAVEFTVEVAVKQRGRAFGSYQFQLVLSDPYTARFMGHQEPLEDFFLSSAQPSSLQEPRNLRGPIRIGPPFRTIVGAAGVLVVTDLEDDTHHSRAPSMDGDDHGGSLSARSASVPERRRSVRPSYVIVPESSAPASRAQIEALVASIVASAEQGSSWVVSVGTPAPNDGGPFEWGKTDRAVIRIDAEESREATGRFVGLVDRALDEFGADHVVIEVIAPDSDEVVAAHVPPPMRYRPSFVVDERVRPHRLVEGAPAVWEGAFFRGDGRPIIGDVVWGLQGSVTGDPIHDQLRSVLPGAIVDYDPDLHRDASAIVSLAGDPRTALRFGSTARLIVGAPTVIDAGQSTELALAGEVSVDEDLLGVVNPYALGAVSAEYIAGWLERPDPRDRSHVFYANPNFGYGLEPATRARLDGLVAEGLAAVGTPVRISYAYGNTDLSSGLSARSLGDWPAFGETLGTPGDSSTDREWPGPGWRLGPELAVLRAYVEWMAPVDDRDEGAGAAVAAAVRASELPPAGVRKLVEDAFGRRTPEGVRQHTGVTNFAELLARIGPLLDDETLGDADVKASIPIGINGIRLLRSLRRPDPGRSVLPVSRPDETPEPKDVRAALAAFVAGIETTSPPTPKGWIVAVGTPGREPYFAGGRPVRTTEQFDLGGGRLDSERQRFHDYAERQAAGSDAALVSVVVTDAATGLVLAAHVPPPAVHPIPFTLNPLVRPRDRDWCVRGDARRPENCFVDGQEGNLDTNIVRDRGDGRCSWMPAAVLDYDEQAHAAVANVLLQVTTHFGVAESYNRPYLFVGSPTLVNWYRASSLAGNGEVDEKYDRIFGHAGSHFILGGANATDIAGYFDRVQLDGVERLVLYLNPNRGYGLDPAAQAGMEEQIAVAIDSIARETGVRVVVSHAYETTELPRESGAGLAASAVPEYASPSPEPTTRDLHAEIDSFIARVTAEATEGGRRMRVVVGAPAPATYRDATWPTITQFSFFLGGSDPEESGEFADLVREQSARHGPELMVLVAHDRDRPGHIVAAYVPPPVPYRPSFTIDPRARLGGAEQVADQWFLRGDHRWAGVQCVLGMEGSLWRDELQRAWKAWAPGAMVDYDPALHAEAHRVLHVTKKYGVAEGHGTVQLIVGAPTIVSPFRGSDLTYTGTLRADRLYRGEEVWAGLGAIAPHYLAGWFESRPQVDSDEREWAFYANPNFGYGLDDDTRTRMNDAARTAIAEVESQLGRPVTISREYRGTDVATLVRDAVRDLVEAPESDAELAGAEVVRVRLIQLAHDLERIGVRPVDQARAVVEARDLLMRERPSLLSETAARGLFRPVDQFLRYHDRLAAIVERARGRLDEWERMLRDGHHPLVVVDIDETVAGIATWHYYSVADLLCPAADEDEVDSRAYEAARSALATGALRPIEPMIELVAEMGRRGIPKVFISATGSARPDNEEARAGQEAKTRWLRDRGLIAEIDPEPIYAHPKHGEYERLEQDGHRIVAVFDDYSQNMPSEDPDDPRSFRVPSLYLTTSSDGGLTARSAPDPAARHRDGTASAPIPGEYLEDGASSSESDLARWAEGHGLTERQVDALRLLAPFRRAWRELMAGSFASKEHAARAVFGLMEEIYRQVPRLRGLLEIGGYLEKAEDGTVRVGVPVLGGPSALELPTPPDRAGQVRARYSWHTHNREQAAGFSSGDVSWVARSGIGSFVDDDGWVFWMEPTAHALSLEGEARERALAGIDSGLRTLMDPFLDEVEQERVVGDLRKRVEALVRVR
ncbi:MAG: pentapeptide repeat-containing protein, partial [Nocardioides sp.]